MPASASLPIPAIADQLAGVELPDPVMLAQRWASFSAKPPEPQR